VVNVRGAQNLHARQVITAEYATMTKGRASVHGLLAVCAIAVAASACTTRKSSGDVAMLTGADWRLVELKGQPALPVEASKRPWLHFGDSSHVFGSGGCNRATGSYTLHGRSIRIGPMAATKMACLDSALTRQEDQFLSALDAADRAEITGDTLVLSKGSERLATMTR